MSSLIRSRQVFNVAMVISVERAATLRRRTRTKVPESRPATPRTEASPVRPRPTTDKEQPFYRRERDSGATALRAVSFNEIAFLRRRRAARAASDPPTDVKTLVERTRPGGSGR